MDNLTIVTLDAQTGVSIVRDLTEDELADFAQVEEQQEIMKAEIEAKAAARASALAKLADLGLTEEEVGAL